MEVQNQVIGIVYALCAGMLFFWAVPSFVLRRWERVRSSKQGGERDFLGEESGLEAGLAEASTPREEISTAVVPPALPRGKVPVHGFGLVDVLGVSLFFGFYALPWAAGNADPPEKTLTEMDRLNEGLLAMLLLQGFQIFLVVVLLFRRMNVVQAFGLCWRRRWWQVAFAPVVVFGMLAFTSVLQVTGFNDWLAGFVEGDGRQEAVKLLAESKDPWTLVLMAAVACIGAPLCEEVVFRGYLYAAVKRFANIPLAVIFTGLFFGAVHGNLLGLLPLAVLGVILALAYEYTGSLWAPIAIHFCFNAVTTTFQIYFNLNPELREELEKNAGFIPLW